MKVVKTGNKAYVLGGLSFGCPLFNFLWFQACLFRGFLLNIFSQALRISLGSSMGLLLQRRGLWPFLCFWITICVGFFAHANLNIRTWVSPKEELAVGDIFTISLSIEYSSSQKPKVEINPLPKNPKISYLRESHSYALRTSNINGKIKTKNTTTINLVYHAQQAGKVHIPQIPIKINGKRHYAAGMSFKISSQGTKKKQGLKGRITQKKQSF